MSNGLVSTYAFKSTIETLGRGWIRPPSLSSTLAHFPLAPPPPLYLQFALDGLPDALHEKLMQSASQTIKFLNNLTSQQPVRGNIVRNAAMPLSAFKSVKALCFSFRRKWAFLGSYQIEKGFVTTKIVSNDGSIRWSAPLFVSGRLFGFGLAIGRQKSGYCLALLNDIALQNIIRSRKIFGLKGDFLVDMDGAYIRSTHMDSTAQDDVVICDSNGGMMARYFRMDALMIHYGLIFGYTGPGKRLNRYVYGDATADSILSGNVEPPAEFLAVLDVLKRRTMEAMPRPRSTMEMAKGAPPAAPAKERLPDSSNTSLDLGV